MGNRLDTSIVLGSKRFKGNSDTDLGVPVTLNNTQKEIDEFDRSVAANLAEIFDRERQSSSTHRITSKIDPIFYNAYSGTTDGTVSTSYIPFTNDLFYINEVDSFSTGIWSGYPQYKEFDFFRDDIGNPHVQYQSKSAYTYNWTYYVSYPYENDFQKKLGTPLGNNQRIEWVCSDGIPFRIEQSTYNGRPLISFICPVNHNLKVGQYVELDLTYSIPGWTGYLGQTTFQVYSLGNQFFGSDEYVFNIYDVGFLGNTFLSGNIGTFKRIIDITNSAETKSIYYVRNHQIISDVDESIMTKSGYDLVGFRKVQKYNYSALTPDNVSRITTKESNQTYNLTFSKDFDISQYIDNLNRPITELYVTIINKGYYGWFNRPLGPTTTIGLRWGYQFNITDPTDQWWGTVLSENLTNIPVNSYTKIQGNPPITFTFYYNQDLKTGDIIQGDFCEYNQYEQQEYTVSELYHKFFFNPLLFEVEPPPTKYPYQRKGYYYKPHFKLPLRSYSTYLEEGSIGEINDSPFYSYYSQSRQSLIWRDIYSYGFIDDERVGNDYPFINGVHYPSNHIIFRILPEGNVNDKTLDISDPIIDDCE